jgi:hypothetical protein
VKPRATVLIGSRNRLWVALAGVGAWTSGLGWLAFHYLAARPGPFGPERSPLEPWWLKIHGAFAFLSLWVGGMLWTLHVVAAWRQNRRRGSGGVLFGGVLLLIATGYLLYYVGDDGIRAPVSVLHWVIGAFAPAGYAAHRLLARRGRATLPGSPKRRASS